MKPGQIKLFLRHRDKLLSKMNSQERDLSTEVDEKNTSHSSGIHTTSSQSAAGDEYKPHIKKSNTNVENCPSFPIQDSVNKNKPNSGENANQQDGSKSQNKSENTRKQGVEEKSNKPENTHSQKPVESLSEMKKLKEMDSKPFSNISQSEDKPSTFHKGAETKVKPISNTENQSGHINHTTLKMSGQPQETEAMDKKDQTSGSTLTYVPSEENPLLVNMSESSSLHLEKPQSTFQKASSMEKPGQVSSVAQTTKDNSHKESNLANKRKKGKKSSSSEEKETIKNNTSANENSGQVDQHQKMANQQGTTGQGDKNYQPVDKSKVKETSENILQKPGVPNLHTNTRQQNEGHQGQRQGSMSGLEYRPGQSLSVKGNSSGKTNKQNSSESLNKKTIVDKLQKISLSEHRPKTPENRAAGDKAEEPKRISSSGSVSKELAKTDEKNSERLIGAAPCTKGQHAESSYMKKKSLEELPQQTRNIPNVKAMTNIRGPADQTSGIQKAEQGDKLPLKNSKKKPEKSSTIIQSKQSNGQSTGLPKSNQQEQMIKQNLESASVVEKITPRKNSVTEVKLKEKQVTSSKLPQMEKLPKETSDKKTEAPKEKTCIDGTVNQSMVNKIEKSSNSKTNAPPPQKLKSSNFRPFGKHDINFKYVQNHVLPPETGIINLITPCHEYKSFATAATLDKQRLLAKLRSETFRFAAACLNVRSNGTIHFGVMDSVEDKGYQHGQIVGIPIQNKDWYADVLNDLDRSFPEASEYAAAAMCIRSPQFIEVINMESEEKRFVVEVDIEPLLISVKEKMFQVALPYFDKDKNKTFYEKKVLYERVGTKSQSVKIEEQINAFNLRLKEADKRRKEAEEACLPEAQRFENLGRKLSVLTTNGKQYFDDTLHYVLVTNACQEHQLEHITFLKYLKVLCVFDFDAGSDIDGLYSRCTEYHATNIYTLQSYANEYGKNMNDIINKMGLFKRTGWVFCNGRKNFRGEDPQCDEHTWIKEKGKFFKKAVSLLCDYVIKQGSFIVLFMLFSPVEYQIAKAFNEFYEEMSGMEYITCIAESREYYEQWASLVQGSCNRTELDQRSVVGMMWSHVNATIQDMVPKKDFSRKLPVSTNAVCVLKIPKEERMNSLNILCLNECENTNPKAIDPSKLESDFYRGGRITWKHFWLAEQNKCGAFIERHACKEVEEMLDGILNKETVKLPVARVNIFHQPGSGGSTVARQILWKNKKHLRCAIVNTLYSSMIICEHAVQLREYEEKDAINCLPVLLLLEDCAEEYIDELRNKLQEAMVYKKVKTTKPCFILLSCRRSNVPEKFCAASHDNTVAITHRLKAKEQSLFKAKAEELNAIFSEDLIITFVLMSQEFNKKYLEDFVKNVFVDLEHSSPITRLIRYVALLNHYVQNSYISLSHCEVLLGVQSYISNGSKLSQNHTLNNLREQALIIELKDECTYISAIRILHPMIAEEILNQISSTYPQSKIALGLLQETAALNHRFGQHEFVTFIKHLFIRRHRKSRGDNEDSFFSPLIEHVCKEESGTKMAIQLLRVAYEQFNKDAHFAQQLARIHYKNHKFEEAKEWVEIAKAKLPDDSYILDTEGRLYKEWFNVNYETCKGKKSLPDEIGLIECGLKSMECFRNAQKAATFEKDDINNSGYFGEVDVGCNLVDLLLMLFNNKFNAERGKAELVKYLTTAEHIPQELRNPWAKVHSRLKKIYQHMYNALEWISEDIGYFQTDKIDVWESTTREDYHEYNPRKWLVKRTKKFADYFFSPSQQDQPISSQENSFSRKMAIYRFGGGSVATILSLLSNAKPEDPGSGLEKVIECYPKEISEDKMDDDDLINLIMSHVALGSVCPASTNLFTFDKLLEMSQRFLNHQKLFPASAYFLLFMLYWPDEHFLTKQHANKTNILKTAIDTARHLHQIRIKNVPVRKKRTNVLFFLGKGYGLQKFIFRGAIERRLKRPLNERTFRWDSDPKDQEIIQTSLKKVDGWTENGRVYTKNPYGKEKIEVLPLNFASVPHGDENVTFYLGFTYIGYVTYGIKVNQEY